jgi:tetratricopeptide (TPR) repeat protein
VVNCFGLYTQSIDGAVSAAESIVAGRLNRAVTIIPAPMRVEPGEQLRLQAMRNHARARFEPFLGERRRREDKAFWSTVEIPYKPFYAYYETLATFGDQAGESQSLLSAYEQLTREITDGAVTSYRALPEHDRRRWLAEFERAHLAGSDDVMVLYATVDQSWAEWLGQTIADFGLRPDLVPVDLLSTATNKLDQIANGRRHVVALLSSTFIRLPLAKELWQEASKTDIGSTSPLLIPLRLDISRVASPFRDRTAIDLFGVDADQATSLIRSVFGSLVQEPEPTERATELERTRFPNQAPAIFKVPNRNPSFTGRARQLQELRIALTSTPAAVVPQTLYGLGGVGKTQIAIEYAHRFRSEYDMVWWVPADQLASARASLAELGAAMRLPSGDAATVNPASVIEALTSGSPFKRWLLIFDNADTPDSLVDVLPPAYAPGHVLLTSRDQTWSDHSTVETLSIGLFEPAESVTLLRTRAPELTETEARRITDALDNLPLAVEQAGAWLHSTHMTVDAYLEMLQTEAATMLERQDVPGDYAATAVATWTLSWGRLREMRPAAAMVLEQAAFFAAEPIPQRFLLEGLHLDVLTAIEPNLVEPMFRSTLIRDLGRFSLVQATGEMIQLHRLVQAVIRAKMDPAAADQCRDRARAILVAQNPQEPDSPESWMTYREILPHARDVGIYTDPSSRSRLLTIDLVRSLLRQGDSQSSRLLGEEILDLWKPVHGDDDRYSLQLELQVANALRAEAQFESAREIDERVRENLTITVGADDPYTLMAARSCAADLRVAGQYQDAHDLDDDLLPRFEEHLGDDDPQTLMARNNLAVSKRLIGDFGGATDIDRRIYEDRRRLRGEEHSSTLASANHYGRDLRDIGNIQGSKAILEQILTSYYRVPELGSNHRETIRAAKNLAVTLRKLGEFERAHELVDDTLRRARQVYGAEHPETLACEMTLATTLSALRHHTRAIEFANSTLLKMRRVLHEGDVYTVACTNNLAIFLRKDDRADEAFPYAELALVQAVSGLTTGHPYIHVAQMNLATALSLRGDNQAALVHAEAADMGLRSTLGDDHPDTIGAGSNLALIRVDLGDPTGERLYQEMLSLARTTMGLDNTRVVSAARRERINCYIEPPPP